VKADRRPEPRTIDLAPVAPLLAEQYAEPRISIDEDDGNVGRGLGIGLTIGFGCLLGVFAVIAICWS
jgi:hypothetical protein